MLKKQSFTFPKTARFFSLGDDVSPKNIHLVFHGYGMLAAFFIKKFEDLVAENNLVIAPEGMYRFYTAGVYGRVGATWMTKDDREMDILDIQNMLGILVNDIQLKYPNANFYYWGFSQGGTTAARFISLSEQKLKIQGVCIWGTLLAEDVLQPFLEKTNGIPVALVNGTEDEFLKQSDFAEFEERLKKDQINFQSFTFSGKHEINAGALKQVWNYFQSVSPNQV